MTPTNPLFALVVIIITMITGYVISLQSKPVATATSKRFETIDGLRGLLAINVFICHSNVWHHYVHSGDWVVPKSNLFNQLGEASVAFFFMISSFLFTKSLIDYKGKNYNWKLFFKKRLLRLAPLHFFIATVIVMIIFFKSNWTINTNPTILVRSMARFFSFGVFDLEPINNISPQSINAGVLWTLRYEWLLYFSLPLVATITLRCKPNLLYLLLSLAFIIITLQFRKYSLEHLISFIGGAIAPIIMKYQKQPINYNNIGFTCIVLASLVSIPLFHSSSNLICKMLIIIAFTIIALGNHLFGVFKSKTLKLLGEISYSTYLTHGVVLYVTIHYIYGFEATRSLSPVAYCLLIFMVTPLLIFSNFLTYRFIEKPFIKKAKS